MEKKYFGYIRVSTAKQGEKGVSLQEQKSAILQYAHPIWFDPLEMEYIRGWMEDERAQEHTRCHQELHSARLRLDEIRSRLGRLTDAFIDGNIEKPIFDARKAALLNDEQPDHFGISSPQLQSQSFQQPLKPLCLPAGFHANTHRLPRRCQRMIELLSFLGVC